MAWGAFKLTTETMRVDAFEILQYSHAVNYALKNIETLFYFHTAIHWKHYSNEFRNIQLKC